MKTMYILETRDNMSKAKKGQKLTQEHRDNISKARRERSESNSPKSIVTICRRHKGKEEKKRKRNNLENHRHESIYILQH